MTRNLKIRLRRSVLFAEERKRPMPLKKHWQVSVDVATKSQPIRAAAKPAVLKLGLIQENATLRFAHALPAANRWRNIKSNSARVVLKKKKRRMLKNALTNEPRRATAKIVAARRKKRTRVLLGVANVAKLTIYEGR